MLLSKVIVVFHKCPYQARFSEVDLSNQEYE